MTDVTPPFSKLSDFVELNAQHFVCRGKTPPEFIDEVHRQLFLDKLFATISPQVALTAGTLSQAPLTPGHTYHLQPWTEQIHSGLLLLSAADSNPEKGGYAISPMNFLNAFADSSIHLTDTFCSVT